MTTKKPNDKKSNSRGLHVKVKTAKKRSTSSTRWLARQLNDPYVVKAKQAGYRSRAAFKLVELDEKFGLLKPGMRVVDLGCAPGGLAQVAVAKVGKSGLVIGCDLLPVDAVPGATLIVQDFLAEDAPDILKAMLLSSPSPRGGREGRDGGANRNAQTSRPLTQPSPARGEGLSGGNPRSTSSNGNLLRMATPL
jgi:23S rRNA (uridine2552-2'-O)-methyltransferase